MNASDPKITVVVPTYNEVENIEPLVAALLEVLPRGSRVTIVDDNSPDGTGAEADRIAAAHPVVDVLHRDSKEGLGPAYVAGFEHVLATDAELIVQMDADFSHDPADVPRLIAAAAEADLVLGSRYVAGGEIGSWGQQRRRISRWGSAYARIWLGLGVQDLTGGFKCFRREALAALPLDEVLSLIHI